MLLQTTTTNNLMERIRDKQFFPMFINNEWVESESGQWMDVINPADGQLLGKVPAGTKKDVDRAVNTAYEAFQSWKTLLPAQRSLVLLKLADLVEEHIEYLALADAIDSGNPVTAMKGDMMAAARQIRYFAGLALEMKGNTFPFSGKTLHSTIREPFGVVGRIIPFNHPIMFAAAKIAAPLAAGNTVVLKAPDQTPIAPLLFAELASKVLPAGVLNVVTGDGAGAGDALVRHPKVKKIAFTGGGATGKKVLQAAAEGLKIVSLELGGKNPMLVYPDIDVDEAVASAVKGMNFDVSQGQSCGSTSRVYIHHTIYDEFVSKLTEQIAQIKVGLPTDPKCQMGPVITEAHLNRIDGYVQRAVQEGAKLLLGGKRVEAAPLDKGYFYPPTVLEATHHMEIAKEELFGPVIVVIRWEDEDELLRFANDSDLGLTASIWTNDIRRAYRVATALETGYVWINDSSARYLGTPFGGYKQSGIGVENSIEEMLSYTQIKTVNVTL